MHRSCQKRHIGGRILIKQRIFWQVVMLMLPLASGFSQVKPNTIPLENSNDVQLSNVRTENVKYKGRRALRVSDAASNNAEEGTRLVILKKTEIQDGVIEVDLTGAPGPNAGADARGFVGIAFRLSVDDTKAVPKYECFYLRPTNGRADDQIRRNHTTQYEASPDFPWHRLRKEFPEKYESYVDIVSGEWTRVKIEVRGDKARLYVNNSPQPVLVVNDLKHGQSQGKIALWVGNGTVAHFSNLRVYR